MSLRLGMVVALLALVFPLLALAQTDHGYKPKRAECQQSRQLVSKLQRETWRWQDKAGRRRTNAGYIWRTAGCGYVNWLVDRWKARVWQAKRAHNQLRDFVPVKHRNAWLRAVEEVQRPYPGTKAWLLSCSDGEGGWGRWVPNSEGSGVGGWMQMFPSTFWRMFKAAYADVTARGFKVPVSAASWYSTLGQALGSAWGVTHGRRGEWAGSGC